MNSNDRDCHRCLPPDETREDRDMLEASIFGRAHSNMIKLAAQRADTVARQSGRRGLRTFAGHIRILTTSRSELAMQNNPEVIDQDHRRPLGTPATGIAAADDASPPPSRSARRGEKQIRFAPSASTFRRRPSSTCAGAWRRLVCQIRRMSLISLKVCR